MPRGEPIERLELIANVLQMLPRGRLLDFGCGHGAVALLADRLGWRVTAVDVRTARMPMSRGIKWIESDVRTFRIDPGAFDCITVLGLLYHLELADQLTLLQRCASTVTVVDTHISLRPTHEEMGYTGELFDEVGGWTADEHAQARRSSWKNANSFWADEPSLLRMFSEAGFASTYKLSPPYRADRTFYICLPDSHSAGVIAHTVERVERVKKARSDREGWLPARLVRRLRARM